MDRDEAGQARRGIGVLQDITERKAAEEHQIQAQKLESLGVLAGGIAHDFNNLLTGILGNLSLARMDEPLGDKARCLLAEAEDRVQRARGLAHQLLTFSRGGEPHKELVDTSSLLRSAATFANRGTRSRLVLDVPAGLRVLVVDDEAGVRRLLGAMLGRLEAKVALFEAGEPAVPAIVGARAAGRPFDLCILDLTLPGGIDGVETARRIREVDPDVRLLLASGYADSDAIARPAEHGFDAVIRKPFSFDDLRGAIAACLAPDDEAP